METQQDRKLDQVRKLLELAKSDNVNEASNAAAQAQRLMSKFSITEAMIEVEAADGETESTDSESPEEDLLHRHQSNAMPTWKINLAVGLTGANQCRVLVNRNALKIVGRPSDASTVRYLFSYVVREIDRLTKCESALRGSPGRTWCNNFRLGAVSEVSRRVREAANAARKEARHEADAGDTLGNGAALVRVDNALARLQQHTKDAEAAVQRIINPKGRKNGGRTHQSSGSRFDSGGRAAGRRAGASIDIGAGGRAPLGAGSRGALNS